MRSLVIIVAGLFGFFYIDLPSLRRRSQGLAHGDAISIELSDYKEKNKRKQKRYKNKKYNRRRIYQQKIYKLKGTMSKDKRYNDQRKIRRMHRNC